MLLVRLFPLLSPAHDGNEAHCEDILAKGGGGGLFRSVGFARMKREQASGKWAASSAVVTSTLWPAHPLRTLDLRGGHAGLRYDVFR